MKKNVNYGFPLNYILLRIFITSFVILASIAFIIATSMVIIGIVMVIALFSYIYFYVICFRTKFNNERYEFLKKIIEISNIKGNEVILDLGTGSGFLAINFAKNLKNGKVVGIDRYNIGYKNPLALYINILKINFMFNTLRDAKRNAEIENVKNKCEFISHDLTKPLNFPNNYFDIILASEFFYCFPYNKQKQLLEEIDRTLKNNGKIIILETESFFMFNWDLNDICYHFKNIGYKKKKYKIKDRVILRCIKCGSEKS